MSGGAIMDFHLYGGPADGALVVFSLGGAGHVYLVKMRREDQPGVHDVLAYEFANRTDASGRWVLDFVRWVGFQGMEDLKKSAE